MQSQNAITKKQAAISASKNDISDESLKPIVENRLAANIPNAVQIIPENAGIDYNAELVKTGAIKKEQIYDEEDAIYIFSSTDEENQVGISTQKKRKLRVIKKEKAKK